MGVMPANPPPSQSTRLENLSVDSQGAAFAMEGRPVRLNAEGYASPVASMREFYQHALNDYYERSAELSRQAAAQRPPLLRRMLSWIGRVFDRIVPGPRAAPGPAAPPPFLRPTAPGIPLPGAHRAPEGIMPASAAGPAPANLLPADQIKKADGKLRGTTPPILQVVFADQAGVHVIWHLPASKGATTGKGRGSADPKAPAPKLELTYGLDSTMAQRLQDCYGQLAQLGYKIAGLETVQVNPVKSAARNDPAKTVRPAAPEAAKPFMPEKAAVESLAAAEPPPARKARPKPETPPARPEALKSPSPEQPNPSFLPGI
jgi:hypothetical protein